ncbi:hypothetical protein KY319_03955 [Candidatus Woesearchaeota archaeon]|nr:hypothetical protein [Candidatus Woesearchaeota archaeon]
MEYRDKIIALAQNAPLLPSTVAKALNTNSILAGAMLAEMSSKGIVKVSALKVGGSPLYYLPGKEEQLLNYLESLNEKDRRTVQKLQAEKVIRHTEADPLTQVSLMQVKDFAKPLKVSYENKEETFWKWFTLTDQEAEQFIREKLEGKPHETPKAPAQEPAQQEQPVQQTKEETAPMMKETPKPKPKKPTEDFWQQIQTFLTKNNITLQEKTAIKKTEYDLILDLPSPVGKLTYYCKARNKKKITDADISAAYVQGQIKKLPVILLINGELTKQAKTVQSQLKGITITKV